MINEWGCIAVASDNSDKHEVALHATAKIIMKMNVLIKRKKISVLQFQLK